MQTKEQFIGRYFGIRCIVTKLMTAKMTALIYGNCRLNNFINAGLRFYLSA